MFIARIVLFLAISYVLCISPSEKHLLVAAKQCPEKKAQIEAAIQNKKREYLREDCKQCCCITVGSVIPCIFGIGLCWHYWKQERSRIKDRREKEIEKIQQN